MRYLKKIFYFIKRKKWYFITPALSFILLSLWANLSITSQTKNFLYSDINTVPSHKAALVLGTSKYRSNGEKNLYFLYRIQAAALLYKTHKVTYIIVSGDNSTMQYNEPNTMKKELIKLGIPDSVVYLDFAGFRTLDSVVRCKEIFDQKEFIIVSQKFHNERAVFLARKHHIEAIGFNAKDVDAYYGFKTNLREYFARIKVFIDLITGKEPKFLGEKIELGKN
ncbi:MAG: YdcF family protein [Flavobacteriales bacterium]|nr:YdcF family protein [Flavobacteriales bacterium]